MSDDRTFWHPAFYDAIKIELLEFQDALDFQEEKQLTTGSLQMDLLIIKKAPGVEITKSIGRIFRTNNIVEYKSPDDYFSVSDYHKTLAYVLVYLYLNNADIKDITLTVVLSRESESLRHYYEQDRGLQVKQAYPGISYVTGEIVPVQVINRRDLTDETLWLQKLGNDLRIEDFEKVAQARIDLPDRRRAMTYFMALINANSDMIREGRAMDVKQIQELCLEIATEAGLLAARVEEGKLEKQHEIARSLLDVLDVETIALKTGLSVAEVEKLKLS